MPYLVESSCEGNNVWTQVVLGFARPRTATQLLHKKEKERESSFAMFEILKM